MSYRVFAINPGSTSTKVAMFDGDQCIFSKNVAHDAAELAKYPDMTAQLPYRRDMILALLKEEGLTLDGVDVFVGRGGGLLSVEGGTYEIDDLILEHARTCANGVIHPATLGSQLAHEFAVQYGAKAYVVNPPDTDELQDLARMTGIKGVHRTVHLHALNLKETAIRHSKVSVYDLLDYMESSGLGSKEARKLSTRTGGFVSHLGISDAIEVTERAAKGDRYAEMVWNTMIYQIEKGIGAMAAALHGKVDGILLGGGMVHSKDLVNQITESCGWIAPVTAYPGEFEMEAMAAGAIRVLDGEESLKKYSGKKVFEKFDFE